jgi:hypothetical protein
MKKIDAVIIDTYPQNRLAHLAIEKTVQTGLVHRIHTFSTAPIYQGEEFHPINPIENTADYSHFLLNIVPYFVNADAVLVIQWDGMPRAAQHWDADFLNYDYIGAPWGNCDESVAVGNGGFSLRSRKLMETLKKLKIKCDPSMPDCDAEDVVICKYFRQEILNSGCNFAPFALAQKFSVENSDLLNTFGFHGVFNFPHFLSETELAGTADELCLRTGRDLFLINFLLGCLRQGYSDAYTQTVAALRTSNRLQRIHQVLEQSNVRIPGFGEPGILN